MLLEGTGVHFSFEASHPDQDSSLPYGWHFQVSRCLCPGSDLDAEPELLVGHLQAARMVLQLPGLLQVLLHLPDVIHRGLEDGALVPAHVPAATTRWSQRANPEAWPTPSDPRLSSESQLSPPLTILSLVQMSAEMSSSLLILGLKQSVHPMPIFLSSALLASISLLSIGPQPSKHFPSKAPLLEVPSLPQYLPS